MVGDSAVLDYLRANDPGCTLARHGEDLVSDTFAISMGKGFPLRVKINTILARYLASGHLDHLKHKWYGELPCFNRISADLYKPQALEISTVGGVFLMLTLGIGVGIFLLFLEHLVYRYALPTLRTKPKESVWRNRNLMFFSQKLYKFINCVELVSPHHSAKELANSLRTGQIMGLFQKSVKRKENEQRRRRKSKAQFFEMIQEIRRVQKEERAEQVIPPPTSATSTTVTEDSRRGEPTPLHPPEATPAPPSPFSTTTTATTQAPITIDYLPGPNPHEDSEGIIVVNSSVPLGLVEELTSKMGHEDVEIEEDSSSGILILKVSDPEEALEANTFNQQLEDTQTYKLQDTAGECGVCTCSVQEGGVTRRKESGGCLNCLQRQDSARIARRAADGTCYPCSTVASARENPLGAYPIMAGTANGLRHRGSVPNPPTSHLPSPSLRPATAPSTAIPSPGIMQQADVPEILGHATRSLEDLEARTRHSLDEKSYERVRLLPLSQQTAIQSSGSLQLVAALSPGRERVNSDLLRHVSKADLWQLWQDSEKELRVRLRQAETQRDELLRQMSKSSHRDRHPLTEGSSEEWDSKSLEDTMGDAKQLYAAAPHVSRRVEDIGEFPRTGRRMSRERRPDETRLKTTRRDSSTTPRKKKRQRSKSQDYLETRKSTESLEEKKLYPKVEERVVTPRKHSSRRKRDGSQDRRTESEEGPTLQKQRPVVHCSFEGAIDRPDLVDPLGEYCSTPLPLLRSLHQQSKSDSERNYAFLQSLTPERRDERLPHDTYDHIHLKTFCREMKGRGCESDEQTEEDSRLKQSDEERLSIRRRRGLHHGVSGHVETQTRRPRERHPSREAYETPHRRESSLQKDTRQQLHRRPYEREAARDHTSPYSGSHRQQQPPPPLQQHGVRRHTTYDSSSDPEDPIYAAAQVLEAGSTREALGRRQPSHHPYPRAYEGRRSGDRMEDRRSSERKTFRETREPP
ncbi:Glutamate receptor ionotropic, NMDA 3A [Portunus trituberculatus]|uniref:Glutamate receptor ionotropic, NMDA 3A n=3 Tax=Portunus trituberculatus TaxID=210409 RepID=A0A5B7E0N6_PORTR|nr:Glutamate receptor ionotropic, NMDA 3A [Portunus trituberculatus]